jgi:circadian clock protein KaiB
MVHDPSEEENKHLLSQADSQDTLVRFEQAVMAMGSESYVLRLYVAGATPRSIQALERVREICENYLQGRYVLEVIDIYQATFDVTLDDVIAIPTLVKRLPLPLRKIVGTLSNEEKVLRGLDIRVMEHLPSSL